MLEPDINTIRNWEWIGKTTLVMGDVLNRKTRVACGPRSVLRRQVERIERQGYRITMGAAIDFYLFRDSYDKVLEKPTPVPFICAERKHLTYLGEKQQLFINDIISASIRSGLQVTSIESGKDEGQISAQFSPSRPLTIADELTLFKKAIHQMALDKDMSATFMALPDFSKAPSGLSLCLSIRNAENGSDCFQCAKSEGKAAADLKEALDTLADYARPLAPIYCPNPNSYKRMSALKKAAVPLAGSGLKALISVSLSLFLLKPHRAR